MTSYFSAKVRIDLIEAATSQQDPQLAKKRYRNFIKDLINSLSKLASFIFLIEKNYQLKKLFCKIINPILFDYLTDELVLFHPHINSYKGYNIRTEPIIPNLWQKIGLNKETELEKFNQLFRIINDLVIYTDLEKKAKTIEEISADIKDCQNSDKFQ